MNTAPPESPFAPCASCVRAALAEIFVKSVEKVELPMFEAGPATRFVPQRFPLRRAPEIAVVRHPASSPRRAREPTPIIVTIGVVAGRRRADLQQRQVRARIDAEDLEVRERADRGYGAARRIRGRPDRSRPRTPDSPTVT